MCTSQQKLYFPICPQGATHFQPEMTTEAKPLEKSMMPAAVKLCYLFANKMVPYTDNEFVKTCTLKAVGILHFVTEFANIGLKRIAVVKTISDCTFLFQIVQNRFSKYIKCEYFPAVFA